MINPQFLSLTRIKIKIFGHPIQVRLDKILKTNFYIVNIAPIGE